MRSETKVCSLAFAGLMDKASKAALIDALWCACQLGTDETPEQILAQGARELRAALEMRGERVSRLVRDAAAVRIDSDPPADDEHA